MLDYVERRLFPDGIPTDSTMSLTRKDYKLAGEIMAMSIMQGGQAPNLMSSKIYDYLCGKLSVSQIESNFTRELCEKVRLFMSFKFNLPKLRIFYMNRLYKINQKANIFKLKTGPIFKLLAHGCCRWCNSKYSSPR